MQSLTRRGAIVLFLTGGSLLVVSSKSLTGVSGSRDGDVNVAQDSDALLGIVGLGPVKKNSRESMVEFTNKVNESISITVSLDTCTDGTLYDSDESACSVTLNVGPGSSKIVDIEAAVTGTITYSISASSGDSFIETTGSVEAESGNVKSAVKIKKVQKFEAKPNQNNWRIQQVQVQDNDKDDDLDRVEYEITDSNGTTRATRTDPASGKQYKQNNISINPDDASYDVLAGETYTLTVTAYDVDGNFSTETRTA